MRYTFQPHYDLKKAAEEAGIPKGEATCIMAPSQEQWGLTREQLRYIGERLLVFQGLEASAVYGKRGGEGLAVVVPKQTVGGASVDVDHWAGVLNQPPPAAPPSAPSPRENAFKSKTLMQ